ncbi:MAG: GNAT family N-acetyltransferase, partial [Chloroflexi bacterium]|nr:GNAT family N-acetyltransferase [Chloroflexota bacterium]
MIIGNKIILREKRLADARDDYTWEADHELAHLDAAPPIIMPFPQYLSDYADELNHFLKTSRQFAVDTIDGKHIGNCSYYNISESKGEAELGIMIGDRDYWDKGYGSDTVTTLVDYIFRQTKLSRIYL